MGGTERPYQHPGHAYIGRAGLPRRHTELPRYIEGYAAFLREEAGVTGVPVDLDRICSRFGIAWKAGPLPLGTEGWSDGEEGRIHLREDSLYTRQRFTHGHELMELLFFALVESRISDDVWHHAQGRRKETLCNRGAAALLLPSGHFDKTARARGVSLASARAISVHFGISLLATLIGLVERGPGIHALVGWQWTLKPSERARAAQNQLALAPGLSVAPAKRLRVWWVRHTPGKPVPYIPKHKSAEDGSLLVHVADANQEASGIQRLSLGGLSAECFVEAIPGPAGIADVVSLIHLPGDTDCRSGHR